MIKLKNILLEIVSPDIVVGFIDTDLNVVSRNNIKTHSDLYNLYPEWKEKYWLDKLHWRYNKATKTVYWYQARDNKQEDVVKDELYRKYKYIVSQNVYIGDRGWADYGKFQSKAHGLSESMFPKDFNRHNLATCISAAALATDYLLSKGVTNFKIVEGWVSLYPDQEEEDWTAHTWIEFSNGRKFDPTRKQWKHWGVDPNEVEYASKIHKVYTPQEYQEVCKRQPESINEKMSFKDLFNVSTPERLQRSKSDVRVRPLRVVTLDENEAWTFSYKSNPSVTGKPHKGYIKFFKEHVEQGENAEDLDCIVDCTCPDFMYRYAYNDTTKDASVVGPKSWNRCINRKPQPAYDFGEGMCKHLLALQGYLKTKIQPTQTRSNLFETLNGMMGKHFDVDYYD